IPSAKKKNPKKTPPPAGFLKGKGGEGPGEKGPQTFGRVDNAVVGRGPFLAKQVANDGREERKDLAPSEEAQASRQDEPHRMTDQREQAQDGQALQQERDEHGVLTSYVIGNPAPEGSAKSVQGAVQFDGHDEGRH